MWTDVKCDVLSHYICAQKLCVCWCKWPLCVGCFTFVAFSEDLLPVSGTWKNNSIFLLPSSLLLEKSSLTQLSLTLVSFTFPISNFPPIYLSTFSPLSSVSLLLSCSFPSVSSHFISHLFLSLSSRFGLVFFIPLFISFFFVLPASSSLLRLSSILSPTFPILAVSLSLKPSAAAPGPLYHSAPSGPLWLWAFCNSLTSSLPFLSSSCVLFFFYLFPILCLSSLLLISPLKCLHYIKHGVN